MTQPFSYDQFDDMRSDDTGGTLESPGLKDYDNVKQDTTAEGLAVEVSCRLCNKKHKVTLEWPELYVIGSNKPGVPPLMPPGYHRSEQGTAFVQFACSKCGGPGVAIHVTPDEAARHLNAAVGAGFVSKEQAAQWGSAVMQARGQAR